MTFFKSSITIIIILFQYNYVTAQCCTYGKNLILNGNFQNRNFDDVNPPPGFMTDNLWNNGFGSPYNYTVIVNRNHGACELSPQYDHTFGDSNGLYMWFDIGNDRLRQIPRAWFPEFIDTAGNSTISVKVKRNTTYTFSCWVRDIGRNSDCKGYGAPIVGLVINGVDLKELNLGLDTSSCCPKWIQLCTQWHSGNETIAEISIESRYNSGNTDLGIDDVFFGISEPSPEKIFANRDTTICAHDSLEIKLMPGLNNVNWNIVTNGKPVISRNNFVYKATAIDKYNCNIKDSIAVSIKNCKEQYLKLANVFTPNNDLINDQWKVIFKGYTAIKVKIFNRWGTCMYQYDLPHSNHWNGKVNNNGVNCPEGQYFYSIEAIDESKKSEFLHGVIQLIR